jgi:4-amino-4-deoxy-L-arabinose transferase-like glycosyltransferase
MVRRVSPILIVTIFAVLFLVRSGGERLTDPFGESHDGFNAAVWSIGARSFREDPLKSRLGALSPNGRYAHHPPLIYPVTALSQALFKNPELAARLPVVASTIAAAFLLLGLLIELGVNRIPAALCVVFGLSVPMVFTYGNMLDTTMLALGPAAGYLWVWQRSINGRANSGWVGLLAALVCIGSWIGVVLVGSSALVSAVLWRRKALSPKVVVAIGVGAVTGLGMTWAWLLWANGSVEPVLNSFREEGINLAEQTTLVSWIELQGHRLIELFLVTAVTAPAKILAGLAVRRFRPVQVILVATVTLYSVVFFSGAYIHDYWNYWAVLPLTVGAAALWTFLATRGRWAAGLAAAVAALSVVSSIMYHPPSEIARQMGLPVGQALSSAHWPAHQKVAYVALWDDELDPELNFYSERKQEVFKGDLVSPGEIIYIRDECGPRLEPVESFTNAARPQPC